VTAISWLASQAKAGAGGLAVLLDGPQGVSATPDQLGVSLLRAPTWPDPSADNGHQRLRLALVPCAAGWASAGVPRLAQRFREPLWIRPAQKAARQAEVSAPIDLLEGLEQVNPQIRVLSCRPGSTPGQLALRLQNLSPQRQSWTLDSPRRWRRGNAETWQSGALVLKPWQVVALELV
jgi:alpha-mannosidase